MAALFVQAAVVFHCHRNSQLRVTAMETAEENGGTAGAFRRPAPDESEVPAPVGIALRAGSKPQLANARAMAVTIDNRARIPTHLLGTESATFQRKVRTRMVQYMTFWGWALVAIMARSPVQSPNVQVQGPPIAGVTTIRTYKP